MIPNLAGVAAANRQQLLNRMMAQQFLTMGGGMPAVNPYLNSMHGLQQNPYFNSLSGGGTGAASHSPFLQASNPASASSSAFQNYDPSSSMSAQAAASGIGFLSHSEMQLLQLQQQQRMAWGAPSSMDQATVRRLLLAQGQGSAADAQAFSSLQAAAAAAQHLSRSSPPHALTTATGGATAASEPTNTALPPSESMPGRALFAAAAAAAAANSKTDTSLLTSTRLVFAAAADGEPSRKKRRRETTKPASAASDMAATEGSSAATAAAEGGGTAEGGDTEATAAVELTGRPPVVLYMPCDDAVISSYQCLARKQMELFEAQYIDVEAGAQGRNRGIVLGQVGIRCRHCSVRSRSSCCCVVFTKGIPASNGPLCFINFVFLLLNFGWNPQ